MSDQTLAAAERRNRVEDSPDSKTVVQRERRRAGLCFKCGEHPEALALGRNVDELRCCCADCYESWFDADAQGRPRPCADCPHLGNLDVRPGPARRASVECQPSPDGLHEYGGVSVGKITDEGLAGGFCGPRGCPVCSHCNQVMCEHGHLFDPRPRRPANPVECLAAPGESHDPEAEFHYEHNGVGMQAVALIDVRCKRCEEGIHYCSTCGGLYDVPREHCHACGTRPTTSSLRGSEREKIVPACNGGYAAQWCPVCGDCSCPRDPDGTAVDELNTPTCALHGKLSAHGEAVSE